MDCVLSIDIGSSSVRCTAYQKGGGERSEVQVPEQVASAQIPSRLHADGTIDLSQIVQTVEEAVEECCLKVHQLDAKVSHVAITCFVMNLFGVATDRTPATKLMSYAANDRYTHEQSEYLERHFKESGTLETTVRKCGTMFYHTSYAPAQVLALHHSMDNQVEGIKCFTTIPSYLIARWTSEDDAAFFETASKISVSEAAWTGMQSIRTMSWEPTVLEALPASMVEKLPRISSNDAIASVRLAEDFRTRWLCILPHCVFTLGLADGAAANIGSLCVNASRMAITVGTSAAARMILHRSTVDFDSEAFPPRGLWCYCLDKYHIILGGAMTDGGSIYEWCKDTLNLQYTAETEQAVLAMTPGAHGVIVLPFLRGERSMGWEHKARMTIHGVSGETTPMHLYRACMEAVGLRLGAIVQAILSTMEETARREVELVASGSGLLQSRVLQQILCDVLGRCLYTSHWASTEATSRGAAIFAISWNCKDQLAHLQGSTRATVEPDLVKTVMYSNQLWPLHHTLYEKVLSDS